MAEEEYYNIGNDFGFTAVDSDELVTATGESAGINEELAKRLEEVASSGASAASSTQLAELDSKIDNMGRLLSQALTELDNAKENSLASTDQQVVLYKDKLIELEKMILPLLYNLMKNEEKEYIYWPSRKPIITQQIENIKKLTRS